MATVFICIRTYTGVIANLPQCASGMLFMRVLPCTVLCRMVAAWVPHKSQEQVASTECVYQENIPLCTTHCVDKSVAIATYQTFPLV